MQSNDYPKYAKEVNSDGKNTLSSLLEIIEDAIRRFGDRSYKFSSDSVEDTTIDDDGTVILGHK